MSADHCLLSKKIYVDLVSVVNKLETCVGLFKLAYSVRLEAAERLRNFICPDKLAHWASCCSLNSKVIALIFSENFKRLMPLLILQPTPSVYIHCTHTSVPLSSSPHPDL